MATACNRVNKTKINKKQKIFWETFRCVCIHCKNFCSIEFAVQELIGEGVKVWIKNTLGGRGLITLIHSFLIYLDLADL